MHNRLFFLILLVSSIMIFSSCEDKVEEKTPENFITDDLFKKIEITEVPNRIITLAPNLTELAFEIGIGNKIVGNTAYCNYPDSAKKITDVADLLTVNTEKISQLKPDLIFITAEGNSRSEYEKLVELGFKVFVSNPRHYNGIKKTLLDMAKIFNRTDTANAIIDNWESRIEKVRASHKKIVANSVMFLISINPVFSVGKNSFIHQILSYAGMNNITADSKVSYPMFSREEVLLRNPDFILLYETNKNDVRELLEAYPEWNTLSAVINNRVLFINADLYSRPGPRFIDAVENLNNLILGN